MAVRLGDLLVKRGVLTEEQRQRIVQEQERSRRPFGELAETLFGVSESAVESAWAEQYAGIADRVDPRTTPIERDVLGLVNRRQAWQFRVMPLRMEGDELVLCTTQEHLARALRFSGWRLGHRCYFVIAAARALGEALAEHYPMAGMTAEMVEKGVRAA
jgi:hypothetical protein